MSLTTPVAEIVEKSTSPLLAIHPTWRRVSLGDVADILNGFPFESQRFSKRDGKPLLRIRDVGETSTDCGYVGDFDKAYLIRRGDLVVGMDGDFNSAPWLGPEALLNQRVCKLTVVVDGYDHRFLELTLPGYLQAINDATSSVTVKHLSSRSVAEIPLPLPPFPEQRRIVAKIEELFSRLDAGVEELKKAKAQLKRYRQSVLKSAFEGRLTIEWRNRRATSHEPIEPASKLLERTGEERKRLATSQGKKYKDTPPLDASELPELPTGWAWTTAEQLCAFITKGTTPRANKLTAGSGEVPFLKVYNLTFDGRLDFSVKPTFVTWKTHEGELARSKVYPGDVLMNIVGPPLGKVSIVPNSYPEWNINQAIAIFRPLPGYSLRLLSYCLQTSEVLQRARKKAKTTAGQSNLTLEICRDLPLPIPPETEQGEIVAEVERRLSVADAEEKAIEAALKQAARLRQSILKRAFEGRLVPQDPSDEPATELLRRIREERLARMGKRLATRRKKGVTSD